MKMVTYATQIAIKGTVQSFDMSVTQKREEKTTK